jgi:tetratricopeptide (TPR) repeat protein
MHSEQNIPAQTIYASLNDYLSKASPSKGDMEITFESVKSLFSPFIKEGDREINLEVKFFEKSIDELKNRFSSGASKSQMIHLEIWAGQNFEKFGVWDKALSYYKNALSLYDETIHFSLKAETFRSMGHIHMMRNNWEEALQHYRQCLDICQQGGKQDGVAYAYNGMGIVSFEQGNMGIAQTHWQQGLELAEKTNETKLTAQLNSNLGALKSTMGNFEDALGHFNKSATMFEKIGDHRGLAEVYHNMGMTYADMGKWPEASSYFEKSFDLAKSIGDVRLQAMVKLNRVELYMAINDNYAGLAMNNQALQIFLQLQDHLGEAETYKFMGTIYARMKKFDFARTYFDQCIYLAGKYKSPLLEAEAHYEFGIMHTKMENKNAALENFNTSLQLFESIDAENDIQKVKDQISALKE